VTSRHAPIVSVIVPFLGFADHLELAESGIEHAVLGAAGLGTAGLAKLSR
jgi:hypothetical protein